MTSSKCFAVIPAAGQSRRMGSQHKLLLPWDRSTIIECVLQAWLNSQVDQVVLVSRPDDPALHEVVRKHPTVQLVIPSESPEDMKRSVWYGLQHLKTDLAGEQDRWMIAPADLPTLSPSLIDQVIAAGRQTSNIVVPKFGQRQGHPVSFPWSLSDQVAKLGEHEGINRLLERYPVHWLRLGVHQYPQDIDTQDDYQRVRQAQQAQPSQ